MGSNGSVEFGVPGISVPEGSHLCAFYQGEAERDAVLLPFLEHGMSAGDTRVCVIDTHHPDQLLDHLDPEKDTQEAVDAGRFLLVPSLEACFPGGAFDAGRTMEFWIGFMDDAIARGVDFFRLTAEMTWSLRDLPGVEELMVYECALNGLIRYPVIALCLYDLDRFGGDMILDVLKTHPMVLVGGVLHDNPFYVEPEEFLAARR